MELKGMTAFITGGGGGIGGGLAEAFVEAGMNVVLADIVLEDARRTAEKIGSAALAVEMDVTSLDSWAAAREAALTAFGQVDVLCANAGVSAPWRTLIDTPPETFERVLRVNLFGVYNGVQTFAPDMVARGYGHICSTASMNGLIPTANLGPYSISKFGVAGLTGVLRDELAPYGVGVSVIYPGLTRSKMSLATFKEKEEAGIRMHMMEPIWIGRAVVAAIRDGTQHILSHTEHKDAVAKRFSEVLASFGDPAEPGFVR